MCTRIAHSCLCVFLSYRGKPDTFVLTVLIERVELTNILSARRWAVYSLKNTRKETVRAISLSAKKFASGNAF